MHTITWMIFIFVALDWYAWQSVRVFSRRSTSRKVFLIRSLFWILTIPGYAIIGYSFINSTENWDGFMRGSFFILFMIPTLSKLFLAVFLFTDDLVRFSILLRRGIERIFNNTQPVGSTPTIHPRISRKEFFSQAGVVAAALPFGSLMYGVVTGPYRFTIRKEEIRLQTLPSAFDGLKIVQISDIHCGSFTSPQPLEHAVQMIKDLQADIIFFTGDLVNDRARETEPYQDILKYIQAPMGVYSVLGNHDYGDYVTWPDKSARLDNLERLKNVHAKLGWNLLNNRNTFLEKEGERIALAGVENWGSWGRSQKYGKIAEAMDGIESAPVKILLSHDPSHWDAEVNTRYKEIDIMFSGHTHGMQFGIELPGFRWSPVEYFYEQWAGLYRKENQYLYVNRGLGFIGYPGRVGIHPEITVITLRKGNLV